MAQQFHETAMGQHFYSSIMPALVRELTTFNKLIARIVDAIEADRQVHALLSRRDKGGER